MKKKEGRRQSKSRSAFDLIKDVLGEDKEKQEYKKAKERIKKKKRREREKEQIVIECPSPVGVN